MPIYMTMQLPVSQSDIELLSAAMGVKENPPEGLIAHAAMNVSDGAGIRVVDLWETREHFEKFQQTLLGPALEKALADGRIKLDGPPPEPEITDVFDLVQAKG